MHGLGPVITVRPCCDAVHHRQVLADTNEAVLRVNREQGWPAPTPAQRVIRDAPVVAGPTSFGKSAGGGVVVP